MARPSVAPVPAAASARPWWRDAVIYQVYVRSFAAATGADGPAGLTGMGNLAGVRARLPYLADLGVDAVWFNPWYPSPMADAGYDVADYRAIDPLFGTLDEAEKLIAEAHELGIRIILDIVPNHGSDAQAWFTAALAARPGSPERDRFIFRPGRGEHGERPPNNWVSEFGGPAWTRLAGPDGQPGEWYLHLFTPEQPDFNWANADVQAEFEDVLRFWFDRGVDGFRIDSAVLLAKDPAMTDHDPDDPGTGVHPFVDRDEVHDVYRAWRSIADSYPGDRVLIGEVWLPDVTRTTRYLRPGELQTVFNFDFLRCPWDAAELRQVIEATLASHRRVEAPATWVLSNHDVIRNVTRYGRADTSFDRPGYRIGEPTDLVLGTRRARAAALLSLSLPGTAYIYQGEELGLWEVEDLPDEARQDPMWQRSNHEHLGRDGCRVPLPWSGDGPPFGFLTSTGGLAGESSWLPQPSSWASLTVESEAADPHSMLSLYRHALQVRHREPAFTTDAFAWLPGPGGALSYRRGPDVTVLINLSTDPVDLPPHEEILAASQPVALGGQLPPDSGVWLRTRPPAS
ncbi:MAG TPA: glycoside hydrolase family 13 protein [Streptosporangiaceae bacterium]|nr:glycoside hydrolase family 13 protein [Streptosporangiaceae bacterium]